MAVILDTKPRFRLPPGDLPGPKPTRSRSWIPFYVMLWIGAVVVGHGILYRWLPGEGTRTRPASAATAAPGSQNDPFETSFGPMHAQSVPQQAQPVTPAPRPSLQAAVTVLDLEKLPACETIDGDEEDRASSDRLLPVDLSRTPLGALLDFGRWTGPCRGRRPVRVHLCLAVKNGTILAATARADPQNTALERCVIRAASHVLLEPEDTLRRVQLDVEIAAERPR